MVYYDLFLHIYIYTFISIPCIYANIYVSIYARNVITLLPLSTLYHLSHLYHLCTMRRITAPVQRPVAPHILFYRRLREIVHNGALMSVSMVRSKEIIRVTSYAIMF